VIDPRPLVRCVLSATIVLALVAGTLHAQPAEPAPAADAAPAADQSFIKDYLARAITRVTLVDLRVIDRPRPEDYRIASRLLTHASELVPNDLDILRLALDASAQCGEFDRINALNRRIVALDPSDTRAQLSLIATRINQEQSVEARQRLYDSFLSDKGTSLDASIRSRLALDAALLARERGDAELFVKRLGQSVTLDPTNKEAASLAYSYYTQRVDDPIGRFELLVNVLRADPLDFQTHLNIARELADNGAHASALRFFTNVGDMRSRLGMPSDEVMYAARYTADWMTRGGQKVFDEITERLDKPRRQLRIVRADAEAAGKSLDGVQKESDIRLPLETDQVRLAIASSLGNEEQANAVMTDILGSLEQIRVEFEEPARRTSGRTEELLRQELTFWRREVVWMGLWSGRKLEDVEKLFPALRADAQLPAETLERLENWLKLRKGEDLESLKAYFAERAATDPLSKLALEALAEKASDKAGAAKLCTEVYLSSPGSLVGAWARTRAVTLGIGEVAPPKQAASFEASAKGVPEWMDQMIRSPRTFVSLAMAPTARSFDALAPTFVTIRVRNTSQLPLAVGPEAPISSRFLLQPLIQRGAVALLDESVPEVIKLDQRLRLMPREEMVTTVWAEPGFGGWSLQFVGPESQRIQWRLMQGFLLSNNQPVEGPFSLNADSGPLFRGGVDKADMPNEDLVAKIASAQGRELAHTLAVARLRLMAANNAGTIRVEQTQAICKALFDRYQASDASVRALILTTIPTGRVSVPAKPFERMLRDVEDKDPIVILLRLVTRGDDASDPAFVLGKSSPDKALQEMTAALEQRLTLSTRSFSRLLTTKRMSLPSATPEPNK
jgi:hypothetical protein